MEIIHAQAVMENAKVVLKDLGVLKSFDKAEFVISDSSLIEQNDFEVQLSDSSWNQSPIEIGDWVYIPNSEWGGRVEKIQHIENVVKVSGVNFRYFISRNIICPPYDATTKKRKAFLELEGDANEVLSSMKQHTILDNLVDLFAISDEKSQVLVSGDFSYCDYLSGAESILNQGQLRLNIVHCYGEKPLLVEAKPQVDYSEYFNEDFSIGIDSSIDEMGDINFMIGLGSGNLGNRLVLFMKKEEDGTIGTIPISTMYLDTNILTKPMVLEVENADTEQKLKDEMLKKFSELKCKESITLNFSSNEYELNLGDIVGGVDSITNIKVKKKITQKILTIDSKSKKIQYKVGD